MEQQPPEQRAPKDQLMGPLAMLRSMEVPPEILRRELGQEIQERLVALRPVLLAWELTEERTEFFLDHRGDLTKIFSFLQGGEVENREKVLSPVVQWYLHELRRDLQEIIESGATTVGIGSYFAISNRPSAFPVIRPKDWNSETIAFVEQLRPHLATIIKARYIDHWLQTPLEILGKLSPIQVIEYGGGDRIRALVEEMWLQG